MKRFFVTYFAILSIGFQVIIAQTAQETWIPLFDGKTLNDWKANESPTSFKVENGQIVCGGLRAHLFYVGNVNKGTFKNFELKAEIKTANDANSGIYFHTQFQNDGWPAKGYEVQVMNSPSNSEHKKTGSLYAVRNVYKSLAKDGEWFTMHIIVKGQQVMVYVNGIKTADYTQPVNPARDASFAGRLLSGGMFALQCHDPKSTVYYKSIAVKILPNDAVAEAGKDYFTPEKAAQVDLLINQGYPIIDYHVHLKGGVTIDDVVNKSLRTGIFCGIAPNCGVGFPVDTNDKLEQYYAERKDVPVFLSMQAEGREWVNTFKKESISKFDYVFTDAMTWTNNNGKRMRLWLKEETEVGEPQVFMDMLVDRILSVLNNEKIDIYANATFIPEEIASGYNELWTDDRMNKVADGLVKNNIAMEISSRYKIPSAKFIKLAKAKGVKFSLGTNNLDQDFGNLDYSIQMIKECDLKPSDIFFPQPDGKKPIQIK